MVERNEAYQKLYLNTVFDPSARYTLDSLIGYLTQVEVITEHLCWLFDQEGASLIFKRDNAAASTMMLKIRFSLIIR